MRVPLNLRTPLPPDDEDRELVELGRHRGFPAQVMKKVEQKLAEHRASHHRVVRPAETDARDFHHLLAERFLLRVELVHGQLREARLLARRRLHEHRGGEPAAGRGNGERRHPDCGFHDFLRVFIVMAARSLVQPRGANQMLWNPINALTFENQYPKISRSMESANVSIPYHATGIATARIVVPAR